MSEEILKLIKMHLINETLKNSHLAKILKKCCLKKFFIIVPEQNLI